MITTIISMATAAGIGYVCGTYHKQIIKLAKIMVNKIRSEHHNKKVTPDEKEQNSNLPENNRNKFDMVIAKEEFIQVADKFAGIYESLYFEASKNSGNYSYEVIEDWNTRIKYLNNKHHFQTFWNENKTDLQKVLCFFYDCGVERDNNKEVIADERTHYRYQIIFEDKVKVGNTYSIVIPCWTLRSNILEKGMLKTKE